MSIILELQMNDVMSKNRDIIKQTESKRRF